MNKMNLINDFNEVIGFKIDNTEYNIKDNRVISGNQLKWVRQTEEECEYHSLDGKIILFMNLLRIKVTCRFFEDASRVVLVTDNGDFNLKDYWLKNMSLYGTTKNAIFLQFDENDIRTIFMGYEARENRVDLNDTFFVEFWPL